MTSPRLASLRISCLIWALYVISVATTVGRAGSVNSSGEQRRRAGGPVKSVLGERGGDSARRPRPSPAPRRTGQQQRPDGGLSRRIEDRREESRLSGRRGASSGEGSMRQRRSDAMGSKQRVAKYDGRDVGSRGQKGGSSKWPTIAKIWLREAKAALSSELEGVLVKATRPDDKQVKLKHLDPLLAISYQTPPELDPYPPVLRKLWAKMVEGDYRTCLKALYILHRLAANGAVEHAHHLHTRLNDMLRQMDSRTKANYFRTDSMSTEDHPFVRDYATYVLYRTTHWSPGFLELTRLGLTSDAGGEMRQLNHREREALYDLLEETLRKAFSVRLSEDDAVTELTSVCAEAIFFDVQQILDILAELLSSPSIPESHVEEKHLAHIWNLYHGAVEGVNAFVADQASLTAPHGVTLREMKSVLTERKALGAASPHPLIEEVDDTSDEAGPVGVAAATFVRSEKPSQHPPSRREVKEVPPTRKTKRKVAKAGDVSGRGKVNTKKVKIVRGDSNKSESDVSTKKRKKTSSPKADRKKEGGASSKRSSISKSNQPKKSR